MSIEPGRSLISFAMRDRVVATGDTRRTKRVVSRLSAHLLDDIGYVVLSGRIVARDRR
jgi:hypothetical protein